MSTSVVCAHVARCVPSSTPAPVLADQTVSTAATWSAYTFSSSFVHKLTQSLASPVAVDKLGNSLHMLCAREGVGALISALRVDGQLDTRPNALGDVVAHAAAAAGCWQSIRVLKQQRNFRINARNNSGDTALMTAVQHSQVLTVYELLMCPGVDVYAINKGGDDCVSLACMLSNYTVRSNTARPAIVLALLEAGASASHVAWGDVGSGQLMALRGDVLGLWMLLCYGADPAACETMARGRDCKLLLRMWQQRGGRDTQRGWECLDQLSVDTREAARAAVVASPADQALTEQAIINGACALLLAKRLHEEAARVGIEVRQAAEGQPGMPLSSMRDLAFYEHELEAMNAAYTDVQLMAQVYGKELQDEVHMATSRSQELQADIAVASDYLKWAKPRKPRREPPLPVDQAQLVRLAAREQRLEMEERLATFPVLQRKACNIKVVTLLDKYLAPSTAWQPGLAYSQLNVLHSVQGGGLTVMRAERRGSHLRKLLFKVVRGEHGIVESLLRWRPDCSSGFINVDAVFEDRQYIYLEADAKGTECNLQEWWAPGTRRVGEVYRCAYKLVKRLAELHSCGLLTGHFSPALVFMHPERGPLLSCVQAKCGEMPPAGAVATGEFSSDVQYMGGVLRSMVMATNGAVGRIASRQLELVQAASAYCLAATTPSAAAVLDIMRMHAPSSYLFAGPGLPAA